MIKNILKNILNFFYPPYCSICNHRLYENEEIICDLCWKNININDREVSKGKNFYFDYFNWLFIFDIKVLDIIHQLKYEGKKKLVKKIKDIASEKITENRYYNESDLIIPVPLHRTRLAERGYNQSEVISNEISELLMKPVCTNILIRTKNNKSQTGLNRVERKKNVEGIFKVRNFNLIRDKSVILIDDVFTTGATVNECARVLKKSYADKVNVFTLSYAE